MTRGPEPSRPAAQAPGRLGLVLATGISRGFLVSAGVLVLAVIIALAMIRIRRQDPSGMGRGTAEGQVASEPHRLAPTDLAGHAPGRGEHTS